MIICCWSVGTFLNIKIPMSKNAIPTVPNANMGTTALSSFVAYSEVATSAYAFRAESRSCASNLAYSRSSSLSLRVSSGLPVKAFVTPSTVASSTPSLSAIQATAAPPAGPATAVASAGATPLSIPSNVSNQRPKSIKTVQNEY